MRKKQADRIIELLELIYSEVQSLSPTEEVFDGAIRTRRPKMIDGRPRPTPNITKKYRKGL